MQITCYIKPCNGIQSFPETIEIPMSLQSFVLRYAGKFSDLHPAVHSFLSYASNRPCDINPEDYFYSYEVL